MIPNRDRKRNIQPKKADYNWICEIKMKNNKGQMTKENDSGYKAMKN